jgi:hypothetical protein
MLVGELSHADLGHEVNVESEKEVFMYCLTKEEWQSRENIWDVFFVGWL